MTQPTTADAEKLPSKLTTRRSVLLLMAMLAVVVIVPMALDRQRTPVEFDQSAVDSFSESQAEVVFIGNSLLNTRIDPDYFAGLTNSSTASLGIDGIAPGIWYLQMANVVAAAKEPPEQIFVFFHDDLITRPIYFTGVKDQRLRDSLTHSNSSGYSNIPVQGDSLAEKMTNAFEKLYPLSNPRATGSDDLLSSIASQVIGLSDDERTESTAKVFGFANRRDQAAIIQQPKYHGTFASMIEGSFLPPLIEIANKLGSEITFVRVAARPNSDGTPNEPESLANYSEDIDAYLTEKNIRYVDMISHIDEGAIDAAMYFDGYHMKQRFRQHYTEFFAEWMNWSIDPNDHSGTAR
jgi:hypothetical protein